MREGSCDRVVVADGGLWQILTAGSVYDLDLDESRVRRRPVFSVPLRQDRRWATLHHVYRAVLGEPMCLRLDVRGDGVDTLRFTSVVLSIQRVVGEFPPKGDAHRGL